MCQLVNLFTRQLVNSSTQLVNSSTKVVKNPQNDKQFFVISHKIDNFVVL